MPRITVADQLQKIRSARVKLEQAENKLLSKTHDKVLAQIVQLTRDAGLSHEQVMAALGVNIRAKTSASGHKAPRPSGSTRKVAPKYRDLANPDNTWTGRGRMPKWVAALHAKGELDNATIKP